MHKKLASDLISLAHSILQMKNKEDVLLLKEKAYEVYEKLSVLAYVDEYINNTPQAEETKEELVAKIEKAEKEKEVAIIKEPLNVIEELEEHAHEVVVEDATLTDTTIESNEEVNNIVNIESQVEEEVEVVEEMVDEAEPIVETKEQKVIKEEEKEEEVLEMKPVVEEIIEQPFDELQSLLFSDDNTKDDVRDIGERKTPTLEDELKDTLPVDVMANLFEKAEPKKSLNDHLQSTIQIGLNDRIAFVKNLFEGNQTDFNRVISQLNTCKTEKEAKKFINKLVKPDYDWSDKEEYETRLLEIIERRFA
ncbi:hypothetical protein [Tenacibaculum sp. 190524A02b]|uniref:hypothetical protein n=1 Tax=Tenacibaculum vairaonense TaxID=3137860 RepID=UPI0031FB3D95